MDVLPEWRKEIDKLDDQLIRILAERFKVTDTIGTYKHNKDLKKIDPAREAEIMGRVSQFADEYGLDPRLIQEIYPIILKYSKISQKKQIDKH